VPMAKIWPNLSATPSPSIEGYRSTSGPCHIFGNGWPLSVVLAALWFWSSARGSNMRAWSMASEICVAVHQTVLKIYAGYGLQLGNTTCGFQFLDMQERCFVLLVTPDYLRKTEYVHELIIGSI